MSRGRRELTVGMALWLALPVFAAAPATTDSIDAAARQLSALKADADAAHVGNSTAGLPNIAMPELQETPSAVAPLLPSAAVDHAKKKRSANWLVDGVMQAEARDRRLRERQRNGRRGTRDRDMLAPAEDDASLDPADATAASDSANPTEQSEGTDLSHASDRSDPRPARRDSALDDSAPTAPTNDPVFNPLTRYMRDWLAPQEDAALRDALGPAAPAGGGFPGAPAGRDSPAGSPLDVVLPGLASDSERGAAGFRATKPVDNPYLQALAAPPDPAPLASAAPDGGAAPATLWAPPVENTPAARPMEEPPKSSEPDFAKPFDDDKYYKPLKRF